jgi:hypothetical protein
MKKNIFYFLFLLFLFPFSMTAQESTSPLKDFSKHEIGISAGAFPVIGFFYKYEPLLGPVEIEFLGHYYYQDRGDGLYLESYLIGAFSMEYKYNFTSRHAAGITVSWACRKRDVHLREIKTGTDNYFVLQAGYRFTYKRFKKLSLYSALYAGATFYLQDKQLMNDEQKSNFWVYPSLHLTLFGISVGKKNAADFEVGFGTQGLIKVGYCYKFGK